MQLTLANIGDRTVRIVAIKKECGCTRIDELEGVVLEPNEETTANVDWEIGSRAGATAKTILITTLEGERLRNYPVRLRGKVKQPLYWELREAIPEEDHWIVVLAVHHRSGRRVDLAERAVLSTYPARFVDVPGRLDLK